MKLWRIADLEDTFYALTTWPLKLDLSVRGEIITMLMVFPILIISTSTEFFTN